MKTFKLAAIVSLVAVSSASFAANQTFQATVNAINDATITETTPLHFGAMQPTIGATCNMDNGGAVTGDCDAANANIALGAVTVSGLVANTPLNITVTGGAGSNVSFTSTVDINGGASSVSAVADATQTAVTVDGTGSDLTLNVYGAMTVDTALTPGASYTTDYVVDVSFQ